MNYARGSGPQRFIWDGRGGTYSRPDIGMLNGHRGIGGLYLIRRAPQHLNDIVEIEIWPRHELDLQG